MRKTLNKKVLFAIMILSAILALEVWAGSQGKSVSRFFTGKVERKGITEEKKENLRIIGTVLEETEMPPPYPIIGAEVKCGLIKSLIAKTGEAGEFMLEMPEQVRPFFLLCEIIAEGYQTKKMNVRIIDRWKMKMGKSDVFNIGVIDLIKK